MNNTKPKASIDKYLSKTSFEMTAIFIFILVLVSNLLVILFRKSYFEYFDIDFELTNFTPQMHDYIEIAVPIIIISIFVTVMIFYGIRFAKIFDDRLGDITLKHMSYTKLFVFLREHPKLRGGTLKLLNTISTISLIFIWLFLFYSITYGIAPKLGYAAAANTNTFISISQPNEVKQEVIIYKNGNEAILKVYDIKMHRFEAEYRLAILNSIYTVHHLSISTTH